MHHSGAALDEPVVLFGGITGGVLALASVLSDKGVGLRITSEKLARLFERLGVLVLLVGESGLGGVE